MHLVRKEYKFIRNILFRDGEEDRVRELLRKGHNPSQPDTSGYTALHYAARAGHMNVIKVNKILCNCFKSK